MIVDFFINLITWFLNNVIFKLTVKDFPLFPLTTFTNGISDILSEYAGWFNFFNYYFPVSTMLILVFCVISIEVILFGIRWGGAIAKLIRG